MNERWAPLASGLAATVVFWFALFGFAALRPDYAHFRRAISELGVFGAPNALAWNLIGFIVPGLLLAACGAAIANALGGRRTALWWLLVAAGVGFAGTGVFPGVMANGSPMMQAPSTIGHVAMMLLGSLCWLLALVPLFRRVWRGADRRHLLAPLALLTLIALATLVANVLHDAIPQLTYRPGLAQRLAFAGFFLWYVGLSLAIALPARGASSV
jgi:Protein of unknown function (DUF998)